MKKIIVIISGFIHFFVQAQQVAPVVIYEDTLFTIKANAATFTSYDRARSIEKKIYDIIESEIEFEVDSMHFITTLYGPLLLYKKKEVLMLLPNDTLGMTETRTELINDYSIIISKAIEKHQTEWNDENRLKKIGFGIFALMVFVMLVFLVNRSLKWALAKIQYWKDQQLPNIKNNKYYIVNANRFYVLINSILKTLRFFIIAIMVYSLLPILFNIFPQTKEWSNLIVSYTLSPLKSIGRSLLDYIPNLFSIIITAVITYYVLKGLRFIFSEIKNGSISLQGFYPDWAMPTFNIIRFLLLALMFIVIWPYLPGSNSPAFQGVSVFLGLLISFGSSSAIANAVAGIVITYMRPFKIGDRVKIGEVKGDVIQKTMLVTRIRTIKNEDITVPNSTILSGYSINYSNQANEAGLILHTSVTIGYDAPWRKVHELLIEAALKTEKIESEPKPFVFQIALNDFYVEYQINAYTHHARGMAGIYSELHQNIQDCFNQGGIEIMSAHYNSIRNGNTTTIPESYRPVNYKSDAFPIKKAE